MHAVSVNTIVPVQVVFLHTKATGLAVDHDGLEVYDILILSKKLTVLMSLQCICKPLVLPSSNVLVCC